MADVFSLKVGKVKRCVGNGGGNSGEVMSVDTREGSRRRAQETGPEEEAEVASVAPRRVIAWATTQIALSALLYLFDFASTLSTLNTYFYYNYRCPYKLAIDPVCFRLATNNNNYDSAFIICLVFMVAAHLSNSFIFYVTLDPSLHPLRLAYFLPLIQLYGLLRLVWRSFSCKSVRDLHNSQQESTNLYNVLGASLDTIPQLILQFNIAIQLLNYSASPQGAVSIPKVLLISIVASLLSATFTGCTTMFSLVSNSTLVRQVCIALIAGVQTFAIIVIKTIMVATLTTPYNSQDWIIPYAFLSMIFPWIFYLVLLQMHTSSAGKELCLKIAKSLALAHVSVFIGPMYVIVKYFGSSRRLYFILILGTLMQIIVEVLGVVEMVLLARYLAISGIACRRKVWKSRNDNALLTCHFVLGIVCSALVLIFFTSVIFIIIHEREEQEQGVNNEIPSSNSWEIPNELDQGQHRASNVEEFKM